MSRAEGIVVTDRDGVPARVESEEQVGGAPHLRLRLEDGRVVYLPELISFDAHGNGVISARFADLADPAPHPYGPPQGVPEQAAPQAGVAGPLVIPVVVEELAVGKREVETGRVRITKTVEERVERVDATVVQEEVEIERVPVNRFVDGPQPVRYEGDTMVIPLLEEVLVVEKRLRIRDEIRVSKRRAELYNAVPVTLRAEKVHVERLSGPYDPNAGAKAEPPAGGAPVTPNEQEGSRD